MPMPVPFDEVVKNLTLMNSDHHRRADDLLQKMKPLRGEALSEEELSRFKMAVRVLELQAVDLDAQWEVARKIIDDRRHAHTATHNPVEEVPESDQ